MTEPPAAPPAGGRPGAGAELWLAAQQEVAAGAAHEIRNALNGVAVNLTVVQSRLRREGAPESVTRFADAATAQLDLLTGQVEALLALVRAPQGAADVGVLVRQLVALSGRRADGEGAFTVATPDPGAARVGLDPARLRALVAFVLAPALAHAGPGRCEVEPGANGGVRVVVRAGGPVALDPRADALARDGGIAVERPSDAGLVLTFPTAHDGAKL